MIKASLPEGSWSTRAFLISSFASLLYAVRKSAFFACFFDAVVFT